MTLIVTTLYNPYEYEQTETIIGPKVAAYSNSSTDDLQLLFVQTLNRVLLSFNNYICTTGNNLEYDVADIYKAFHREVENLRNPCFAGEYYTFNFHPNKYGHQVMADEVYDICLHQEFKITASAKTISFDKASTGYSQIETKTVTISNTGNQNVYISLPTSTNFIIAAAEGFSNGQAFLKPGEKASFTVQPKTGGTTFETSSTGNIYQITSTKGTVEYKGNNDDNKKIVTIPSTVTINGIKYRVTSIADNAFKNNKKLKKVVIGKYVMKIGKKAFFGCTNLKRITFKRMRLKKKTIGAKAFTKAGRKNYKKLKVIVPQRCLTIYKKILVIKGLSTKAVVK